MAGRSVTANQTIFDQVDLFQSDGFTRITGVLVGDLVLNLHYNNALVSWPLMDGSSISDALVVSGNVYWKEIGSGTGFYGVRWRPNAVGYWHMSLSYAAVTQVAIADFDVTPLPTPGPSGLVVSFTK